MTVIKAYQSGHRPDLPYLTSNITDRLILSQTPRDVIYGEADGAPIVEAVHDVEWRVTVQAYGPDPMALLAPLSGVKHLPRATESLAPYRLHEVGRAQFVPEKIQTGWEPRASVRVICHGIHRESRPGEVAEATVPAINFEASP
ncbi:hypothetical protein [Tropicimonas sp. IMCC34011]|uniref:phage neck terminator protein n=1 Tax=Tropicimonas sp. IMCC34011 TaxID=2248759 RepID=UPI0013005C39|nr:hypothetical protein [Tropicimonas sp. IMCC34011]